MRGYKRVTFTRSGNEVVVRNMNFAIFITTFFGVLAFAEIVGALVALGEGRLLVAAVFGPAGGLTFYAGWVMGWHTTVRLRPDGIVIETGLIRNLIPWRQGRQFYVADGLRLRLLDGRSYAVTAFGGTPLGALTGYRVISQVAERLARLGDQIVAACAPEFPPPPTRWQLRLPDWWIPVTIAGFVEVIVGLVAVSR